MPPRDGTDKRNTRPLIGVKPYMRWLRGALAASLLLVLGLSTQAAADVLVCVDVESACPVVPGDDVVADQAAPDMAIPANATDVQTLGPPITVEPFSVAPTPTATPRAGQLVVLPGSGADKQHLPPGPPNFQIDP